MSMNNESLGVNSSSSLHWEQFQQTVQMIFSSTAMWVYPSSFYTLIFFYSLLIAAGVTGNLLVLYLLLRTPALRTARNVFVANLAVSDFCLCLLTMPLTLVEVTYQNWQWGNSPLLCSLQQPLQALFVLISSLSITAIAVDRCLIICWPSVGSTVTSSPSRLIPILWFIAIGIVSPLGIVKEFRSPGESLMESELEFSSMVERYSNKLDVNQTALEQMEALSSIIKRNNETMEYEFDMVDNLDKINQFEARHLVLNQINFILDEMKMKNLAPRCLEKTSESVLSGVNTVIILVVQYVVPVLTVSLANAAIYTRLQDRMGQYASRTATEQRINEVKKMRRTCILLCLEPVFYYV
ncbi:neuropeptides capa receptor [Eurytemora carolleeae]|uniref:neuropeptides capa receptor n=1 Tax=Eurytemora carolleeae TaxID=1294199 RepID=UPI000C77C743|nr:neuropeptides capa receptor [Eurytemora carolleeae]|eukprot:XP_023332440.1 neuropeptides capa receptor-like [Eurytemora affinis]